MASTGTEKRMLLILGPPSLGKAMVSSKLTGKQSIGVDSLEAGTETSVAYIDGVEWLVAILPSLYTITPLSEEQKTAKRAILKAKPGTVLLPIVPVASLEASMPSILVLKELGLPLVLAISIIGEDRGYTSVIPSMERISELLGIPVVIVDSENITSLVEALKSEPRKPRASLRLLREYEGIVRSVEKKLKGDYTPFNRSGIAVLLLLGDKDVKELVETRETNPDDVMKLVQSLQSQGFGVRISYLLRKLSASIASMIQHGENIEEEDIIFSPLTQPSPSCRGAWCKLCSLGCPWRR